MLQLRAYWGTASSVIEIATDFTAGNIDAAKTNLLFFAIDKATGQVLQGQAKKQGFSEEDAEFLDAAAGTATDKIKEGVVGEEKKPSAEKISKSSVNIIDKIPRTKKDKKK